MSTFIIAELGSSHDGSFGNAKQMIAVAAECKVDAVKFQLHIPEVETLASAPDPSYFKAEPRMQYFKRTAFSLEQWADLKKYAEDLGLSFMASAFSVEAVEQLEQIGVVAHKVPSGEVTNLPLLKALAATGKPIYLSSGMSSWDELDQAVAAVRSSKDVIVMQCTSMYPCPYDKVGLNIMLEMRRRYGLSVGLSDHTLTNYSSYAAVSLGATAIEKHFALSRHMYGSDARHSLEPAELADLVTGIRAIEQVLGSEIDKDDITPFMEMKVVFEKSIVSIQDIPAGTVLTAEMLTMKKPGDGMPASQLSTVIGKRLRTSINADTQLRWEHLEAGLGA